MLLGGLLFTSGYFALKTRATGLKFPNGPILILSENPAFTLRESLTQNVVRVSATPHFFLLSYRVVQVVVDYILVTQSYEFHHRKEVPHPKGNS